MVSLTIILSMKIAPKVFEWSCFLFFSMFDQLHKYLTPFEDSKKEKLIRGDIKSNAQRLLTQADVLIVDGSNYIKGFRYEIYCMSKLYKTPQCTVQCDLPVEHAWLWNERRPSSEQYSREIFDALVLR